MGIGERPRVVVTGAGGGLGRAFCEELAARGARLIVADINEEGARDTVRQLGTVDAFAVRCDVTDAAQVEALALEAEDRFNGVDMVINNAGVAVAGRVGEVPLEDWHWIVNVNLLGVVHGCHSFIPRFRKQGYGHVLNVASAAGLVSAPHMAPYNATKAAVVALSETLAAELSGTDIHVSVLCPTFFPTNIGRSARSTAQAAALTQGVEKLMARSKLDARGVAREALIGADANALYVLPHSDGRWMWRLKRAVPSMAQSLFARMAQRELRRAGVRL